MAGCPAKSLAFMDLETTGFFTPYDNSIDSMFSPLSPAEKLDKGVKRGQLPADPRVTELSVVAFGRESFSNPEENCPVPENAKVWTRQLDPTLNPEQWKAYNSNYGRKEYALKEPQLRKQKTLKEVWASLLSFLDGFEKPLCLIAHNGAGYDYRLLALEMQRFGCDPLPDGVYLLDSMLAFREMEKEYVQDISKVKQPDRNQSEVTPSKGRKRTSCDTDDDLLLMHGREGAKKRKLSMSPQQTPPHNSEESVTWTPAKKKRASTVMDAKELKYGLGMMYKQLFNESIPNEHQAEGDCKALVRVCLQFGMDFVSYMDKNAWEWKHNPKESHK